MICSLWLKNFRRYQNQKFTFGEGVNFIDGQNNAGKTTIFYAIEYALFGKVVGVQKLTSLMHPKTKAVGVEIVFKSKQGETFRLQRMHEIPAKSRTKVTGYFTLKQIVGKERGDERYVLSSEFQDREEHLALKLFELTGLSRKLFDSAVHLRQGQISAILEGSKALDHVLGVTASVVAGEEMRAMALEYEKECSTLPLIEESLARLRATQKDQDATLKRAEESEENARAEYTGLSRELEACAEKEQTQRTLVEKTLALKEKANTLVQMKEQGALLENDAKQKEKAAPAKSDDARTRAFEKRALELASALDENDKETLFLEEKRSSIERLLGDLDGRLTRRRAQLESGESKCDACGQAIDIKRAQDEKDEWLHKHQTLEKDIAALKDALEQARIKGKDLRKEMAQSESESEAFEAAMNERIKAYKSLEEHKATCASEEQSLETSCVSLAKELEHTLGDASLPKANEPNALVERLEGIEQELNALRDETIALRGSLDAKIAMTLSAAEEANAEVARVKESINTLAKDLAKAQKDVEALQSKKTLAVKLRTLSAGFKELQKQVRERACEVLARDTLSYHDELAAPAKEYKSLSIDKDKYTLMVTPKDIGKKVAAHVSQGGGHRLLLGLAYKYAIAKLVGPCPFVLLDEPTYGLDVQKREGLFQKLGDLNEGVQTLLITHQANAVKGQRIEIERCDEISVQVAR